MRKFESSPPSQIKCCGCKQYLDILNFWKNKSKPNGYQNHCKACSKGKWGKKFICEKCGIDFEIFHRNINSRKTKYCASCAQIYGLKRVVEANKARATYITYSQRGHRYLLPKGERKYRAEHRIVMEADLGRKLTSVEVIHHIDNDPKNNYLNNLWLCNHSSHKKAHISLTNAAWDAVKKGLIMFDKNDGIYKCK